MNERNRAMKKVFALLLSLVMVVSMMPSLAFAEGSEDASTAKLEGISFSMSPDAEDDEALDIEKTGDNAYTCTTYDSVTTLYAKAKSNNDGNYHVRAVIQNGWQRLCITLNDNTWMSLKSAPVNMTVLVGPGTGANIDNGDVAYTITFAKKPTLISLIVRDNDTLRPVFDPLKTEYTVGVPEDTDTIAMRVTPQTYNASMTINNETASSSEDFQLTMKYDENGRMEVPIELTAAAGTPAFTYYLTFIKESKGDTPVISVQPQDLQAYDSKPRTLSIKATANGDLSYQWYQASSQEDSNGTAIDGATEASYEITGQVGQTETAYYYCVVTNTNDEGATFTAISDTAKVTTKVDPTPTVELQTSEGEALPDDGYAYDMNQEGVTAIQAVPVSRVEGGTYTYEWKTCDTENGYFSINIPGSNPTTEQSFTPPVVKDSAAYYRCYVTYTVGGESFTAASPAVLVKTTAYSASAPDIYGQPKAVTAVVGGKPSRLTCSVYPPTDGGVLSYQWYQGTDDTDKTTFSPVEGATSKNYTPETSVEEKSVYYYCKVTNTLESISGQIYTASVDSDIVSVTFTMPTFKGEGTEDSPYLIETLDDLQ